MGFFDVLIKPKETFEMEKGKETLGKAILPYAILSAIFGVLAAIVTPYNNTLLSIIPAFSNQLGLLLGTTSSAGTIIRIVTGAALFLAGILLQLIIIGWIFLIAKILGGKGSYTRLFYFESLFVWPMLVANILVAILSLIPIIGILIALAFGIWNIYLRLTMLKSAMEFGYIRAIATYLLSIIILVGIVLGIFVVGRLGLVDFSKAPILGNNQAGSSYNINLMAVGSISSELEAYLNSNEFQEKGITLDLIFSQQQLNEGDLNQADVILLTNEPTCNQVARDVIAKRVKAGAKLIIIGDTCSKISGDDNAYGWRTGTDDLSNIIPVTAGSPYKLEQSPQKVATSGKFKVIAAPDHPIFKAINNLDYDGTLPGAAIFEVLPKPDSRTLVLLSPEGTGEGVVRSYRMIIETKNAIYLAFDPSSQPSFGKELIQSLIVNIANT